MKLGKSIYDMNLRVVYYARVSTESDEQLNSLDNQQKFFEDYINNSKSWKLVGKYIDEGISATGVDKRKSFLRMIEDAINGKFDMIITKEVSRFARNTIDSIKYTDYLLKNGVIVNFLNDNLNTLDETCEFRLTIMSSLAQDEVRKLSSRVKFGLERSVKDGKVLGGGNITGYYKEKGRLYINEEEAPVIRMLFSLYATGKYGFRTIGQKLYEEGYKNTKGKPYADRVLRRMLINPKYKGYYCGHKTKVLDYRTKQKKKLECSDWIIYKDEKSVPPIVSEELWNRANKKLKERQDSFTNRAVNKKVFQNRYTYSGKIYCGEHNVTYHRSSAGKRKNNPVWECQVYRKESLKGCSNPRVFELELDDIFKDLFNKLFIRRNNIFDEIINECRNYLEINNNDNEIKILESKLLVLNNKKDKLLEPVMEEYLSKIDYKKQVDLINEEINIHQNKINELQNNKKDKNYIENKINTIKETLNKSLNDSECFGDVFNELVDRIYVYKENDKKVKLEIYVKTGESLYTTSDNSDKKFHSLDYVTASSSSISRY